MKKDVLSACQRLTVLCLRVCELHLAHVFFSFLFRYKKNLKLRYMYNISATFYIIFNGLLLLNGL